MANTETTEPSQTCANCGAILTGAYCAECGQSREDINRPFWTLATDTLDGLFSWDGRLLTTLRQLYTRPGRVARDYADGKRQSFTPPIRLYLIVSLVFFAAMTLSGVRIIAVNTSMSEAGPGISLTMFQPPGTSEPLNLTDEEREDFYALARGLGNPESVIRIALRAAEDPRGTEEKTAAAANQALILMVFVFILMNMALHPRTAVIRHVIHALYYHAAFLPVAGFLLIIAVWLDLPTGLALGLIAAASLASLSAYTLFDRGFYGSSWIGAVLRSLVILVVYSATTILVVTALILVATL
ncbi:DUF3667 domain-containing protein [Hyphobacterium marinum]|uniref:DUF3667 domain-containing protein n=1 Tax=Hyphobacterium marinum TaxID=3116574 RepID=A0ABU7LZI8_9PROT|nr:DUF3667 domain-containing protein [Hyphobacterium sp. Y6023]MEE2566958.1 DUF3667 domain-containing protein [Hyphobacterium sp. Y6023]